MTAPTNQTRPISTRTLVESVTLGAVYGILLRIAFKLNLHLVPRIPYLGNEFAIMTEAFLFLGPIVIGFLCVRRAMAIGPIPVWQWILLPWIAAILTFAGAAAFLLEGTVCLLFALPLSLLAASLGGVIAGLLARSGRQPSKAPRRPSPSFHSCSPPPSPSSPRRSSFAPSIARSSSTPHHHRLAQHRTRPRHLSRRAPPPGRARLRPQTRRQRVPRKPVPQRPRRRGLTCQRLRSLFRPFSLASVL